MLRWKYIIPRVMLVGCLLCVLWLATNPILRWSVIRGGQAATGAKVDISKLRTLLFRAELQLGKLAIADPQSSMQNLLEAQSAVFDVDVQQLLRRRFVVHEGHITGVQLGTPRETSGALSGAGTSETTSLLPAEKPTDLGEKWLEAAAKHLEMRIEGDLESVSLGRELIERWPQEYTRLESAVTSITLRSEQLTRAIEQTKENPLQSVEQYQQILAQFDALARDTGQLRQDLERMKMQMLDDRVAVDRAKHHDWRYIQQRLELAKLDPEAISNYLLGSDMGPRVSRLIQWLQWGRQQLPSRTKSSRPASRGWNVILPCMQTDPSLLVRRLVVDGGGTAGGQPFSFTGTVQHLTSQPRVYGKAATLDITTSGSVAMTIQAVFDHTDDLAQDQIVMECPQLSQPSRTLGSVDKLAVHVAPGLSRLRMDLAITGDILQGTIEFCQPSVGLRTEVGDELGGDLVADGVAAAVSSIHDLQATIHLRGTIQKPRWTLDSNLGAELAGGLQSAFSHEIQQRRQALVAKANQELEKQVLRVQEEILRKQQALLDNLNVKHRELRLLQNEMAQLALPNQIWGEKGLLRKMIRR